MLVKRWPVYLALALVISLVSPVRAGADGSTQIVISELMSAGSGSASDEFVELYNPSPIVVSVSGWTLEYKSATSSDTASSWTKKATLSGQIAPGGFYLVAPRLLYPAADVDWSATLASAGHVRLRDAAGVVVDKLGYGATANAAETAPAAAPVAGQSLERLPGRLLEGGGNGQDTDNNALDFMIRLAPQPQSTQSNLETPGTLSGEVTGEASAAGYLPLTLTEILPNPAPPQTDASDEYIELYNPNEVAVDLAGYQLRGGSDFRDHYTISSGQLAPQSYLAIRSAQSGIGLTNSGGAVQLLDPAGALLDQTAIYGEAEDGRAWALINDVWQWTLTPTPAAANVLTAPLVATATTAATSSKTAKKSTAKTTTKATAKAKASSAKAKSVKVKAAKTTPLETAAAKLQPATWLLLCLGALTIGYAIYEFRHDIYLLFHRARGYHPASPSSGPANKGPGLD